MHSVPAEKRVIAPPWGSVETGRFVERPETTMPMPGGRLIRLSKLKNERGFPVFIVAVAEAGAAIDVLQSAGVSVGREAEDLGPISERLMHRLGLRPRQFVQMKRRDSRRCGG
jgi:hypothetical protein